MREEVKGHLDWRGLRMEPEVTWKGTGSDWKCGGHVIWFGKPLSSCSKKDRGLIGDGGWSSCDFGWETAQLLEWIRVQ